ncbi:MAG TPA: glycosyltransferase [Caldimonas sp.]|nr:glycosyltransferase [Caldimonas sp.]
MTQPTTDGAPPAEPEPARAVVVLLATRNGCRWIDEQIDSIYAQVGVDVAVVASDDGSTDDTRERLRAWSGKRPLHVLDDAAGRLGSANRNFLRLIRDAPIGDATHVALADQDDIWSDDKCLRACETLDDHRADVYSSDVIAFWPDGRQVYIRKSHGLRGHDHLFESAGPGCTFVFRRETFERLRAWVLLNFTALQDVKVHDWLIYAYARTQGWRWIIDARATVLYRQHGANELGANSGLRPGLTRVRNVLTGRYRHDVLCVAAAVGDRSWVTPALARLDLRDRLRLAASSGELRRRRRDQLLMALFLLTMRRT